MDGWIRGHPAPAYAADGSGTRVEDGGWSGNAAGYAGFLMHPFAQALSVRGSPPVAAFHPPVQRQTAPMHTAMSPGAAHPSSFNPGAPFAGQRQALGTQLLRQHILSQVLRGGMGPGGPAHPPALAAPRPAYPTIK